MLQHLHAKAKLGIAHETIQSGYMYLQRFKCKCHDDTFASRQKSLMHFATRIHFCTHLQRIIQQRISKLPVLLSIVNECRNVEHASLSIKISMQLGDCSPNHNRTRPRPSKLRRAASIECCKKEIAVHSPWRHGASRQPCVASHERRCHKHEP